MNLASSRIEKKNLSMLGAVMHAFLGREVAYYPRQEGISVEAGVYLKEIEDALKPLDEMAHIDERYLDRAKDSLAEVKNLTEYQDQKSARLLTIIAFLTAAAGALFAKFIDAYPLRQLFEVSWVYGVPVAIVYLAFGLFIVFVAFGALVSFHATQTRFVWPEIKAVRQGGAKDVDRSDEAIFDEALSHLFFKSIIRTKPDGWANSFVKKVASDNGENSLTVRYYKNYISESYLVAAKCGDKLRYLQPAQKLLQCSIRLLIVWLFCFFGVIALIPSKSEVEARAHAKPETSIEGRQVSGPLAGSTSDAPGALHTRDQVNSTGLGMAVPGPMRQQDGLTFEATSAAQARSAGSMPASAAVDSPNVARQGVRP
ncbi:hypothetical protein [Burkholderia pyrrocinia]|uniref:hypothetical protein n=1 Tax=Burkholderia pyrrocinia TaxID=60550 RepID=UPI0030D39B84